MVKRLILIHGRSIKPAEIPMRQLARDAIAEGLGRAGKPAVAQGLADGSIAFELVYYGDINNRIQADADTKDAAALQALDPSHGNAACLDIAGMRQDFDRVRTIGAFTKARYQKVLETADDARFADEAADFLSLVNAIFAFGLLGDFALKNATPDFAQYLLDQETGSLVRERLNAKLLPAMLAGDDICLVAHSMGSVVAYDQMWKYSHLSEYANVRSAATRIKLWVTIGCPLGEFAVRQRLYDRGMAEKDKHPREIVDEWRNFYAEDDFISHVEELRPVFGGMTKKGLKLLKDLHVYNCWSYRDNNSGRLVANPHDLYGYLMNQAVGQRIGEWAES